MIRIHADDLAGIIRAGTDASADLETCIRDATEAAKQWREELTELLGQFNDFRRAVQEATGLDQRELLHDDELVGRVCKAARRPFSNVLGGPDATAERAMTRPTMTTTVPGPWAPGDLIEHTGSHGGIYVAKLIEPDAADWWNAIVVEVVRSPEDTAGVFVEQSIRLMENGTGNNRRIWAAPVALPAGATVVPPGQSAAIAAILSDEQDGPPIKLDVDVTLLRQAQLMAMDQAQREMQWDLEQQAKAAARDDGPPEGDHRTDAITYAKMIEREKATLADGTQARFFSDERPDDGPPTESMPPVQDPPQAPAGYQIGRVFTRGDTCPAELDMVVNRSGDVMRVFAETGAWCVLRQDATVVSWSEQLHINGLLWELVPVGEHAAEPETAADHDH
jgi:hypothetical protein